MSEICTFTISLPIWFLWAMAAALNLSVVLLIVEAVGNYKLRRLKLHLTTSQAEEGE